MARGRKKVKKKLFRIDKKGYKRFTDSAEIQYFGIEVPHRLIMENVSEKEMAEPILPLMFRKERGGE